jgi:hypothetical protein
MNSDECKNLVSFKSSCATLWCFLILSFLLISHQSAFALEKKAEPTNSIHPGIYADKIRELSDRWIKPETDLNHSLPLSEMKIQSIKTTGDKTYVGILAKALIKAKLENVLSVLKNIDAYKKIYPGLDEISFVGGQDDKTDIHWKFSGPMGTHTVYNTIQRVIEVTPNKALLVYRLKDSKDVRETDGFIFLQESNGLTKYLSVDFFNANWGLAGTFFEDTIWKTSFDNTQKASLAIKSEAEKLSNPKETEAQKVSVSFIGLDDRAKQKTFENLASEIFSGDKHEQPHNQ